MTVTIEGDSRAEGPGGAGTPQPAAAVPRLFAPVWWDTDGPSGAVQAAAAPAPPDLFKQPAPPAAPPAAPTWSPGPASPGERQPAPEYDEFSATEMIPAVPGAAVYAPVWEPEPGTEAPGIAPVHEADPDEDPFGGWDPDEANEEFSFAGPPRRRWLPVAVIGSAILLLGAAGAYVLTSGEKEKAAPPPPSNTPLPATALAPDQAGAFRPTHVTLAAHEGRLQVTWDQPTNTEGLSGYIVVSQTQGGELVGQVLAKKDQRQVVFTGAAAAPGVCAVVTTLINGEPAMKLARGDAVCTAPGAPAASPSAGSSSTPSGGPSPSGGSTPSEGDNAVPPAEDSGDESSDDEDQFMPSD